MCPSFWDSGSLDCPLIRCWGLRSHLSGVFYFKGEFEKNNINQDKRNHFVHLLKVDIPYLKMGCTFISRRWGGRLPARFPQHWDSCLKYLRLCLEIPLGTELRLNPESPCPCRAKTKEQLAALKKHHEDEIVHHKKEIERLQKEIERHKQKIKSLNSDD